MKNWIAISLIIGVVGSGLFTPMSGRAGTDDSTFIVRDAAIAVLFAEAVIQQEYGKAELKRLLPLTATKAGDHWTVRGVRDKHQPKRTRGGIVVVEVAIDGGRILSVHYEI